MSQSVKPSIDTIFTAAIEMATADERQRYLNEACGDDQTLRRQAQRLIDAHFRGGSILDAPPHLLSPTLAQAPAEQPGTIIGPYKLLEQIGEGGMGVVYVAEQTEPVRRRVALKILKPGMDTKQVIARFEAERQALAMMDHPNIARILDAGTVGQVTSASGSWLEGQSTPSPALATSTSHPSARPYFVMELVRGLSITDYCDKARLAPRKRLELFVAVCHAVQHAHQKGIIHRDLKPSNVMVTLHDGTPVVKVIDFGIAKAMGQSLTERTIYTAHTQLVGTPLYMSPEQAELSGLDVDTRSDVYSLGVLLYELLTGHTPFDKDTLSKAGFDEMRRIIREDEPQRPSHRISTLNAQAVSTVSQHRGLDERRLGQILRGELDWIVMRALEKDRGRRYESASSLAADIQRYLSDEPVQACPPSVVYRISKLIRRNKVAVSAASIVIFAILASSAFSAVKYFDERTARRQAVEQKLLAFESAKTAKEQAVEATRQKTEAVRQRGEAVRQKAEAEHQRDAARQNLYYADMRMASIDIDTGNASRARTSVLEHFPLREEADRRGWEWYYLLGQAHPAEYAQFGHRASVSSVDWSSDGKLIASASNDGSVRVWDVTSWKNIRVLDFGISIKRGLAWSPDGQKLAWGSTTDDSTTRIWDRRTDAVTKAWQWNLAAQSVTWSHNGRYLAIAGAGHGLKPTTEKLLILDASTYQPVIKFKEYEDPVSLSWSVDDKTIVFARGENTHLWSMSTAQPESKIENRNEPIDVLLAAWHPSNKNLLALADRSGNCLLWDRATKTIIRQWKAHSSGVRLLRWGDSGNRLLSLGQGTVKVWDVASGREIRSVVAHAGVVSSAAWEPGGKRFVTGGTDRVVRVWSAEAQHNPLVIESKLGGALDLAWDNTSSSILLASDKAGKVVAWDSASGRQLEETEVQQVEGHRLVSFRHFMVRSRSPDVMTTIAVKDLSASDILKRVSPPTRRNGWFGIEGVLSPDRRRIAYVSMYPSRFQRHAVIRDIHSDRTVKCDDIFADARGMAWSPDGRLLALVGYGQPNDNGGPQLSGWVHLFDAESGKRVRRMQITTDRVVGTAVAWSHDGRRIAAANEQGFCAVWQADNGRVLVHQLIHTTAVNDLAWSPDDLRIASGGKGQQVHLWDAATGQELLTLEPHSAPIAHIRWSPDGQKLAAVSEDGFVKVWDATAGYDMPRRDYWRDFVEPRQWRDYDRLVAQQRWSEAAETLKRIISAGNTDYRPLYLLAVTGLQMNDEATYRNTCREMLRAFAESDDATACFYTAWMCSLKPAAIDDYSTAIRLAQKANDLKFNANYTDDIRAEFPETLGAILLRAGKYEEALQQLQIADDVRDDRTDSSAEIAYLTAIVHHRLGPTEEAQSWLRRANQRFENEQTQANQRRFRSDLSIDLFRREARELIDHEVTERPKSDKEGKRKQRPKSGA